MTLIRKRTIAVTGAAGRVGRALVLSLLHNDYRVLAITRSEGSAWELRKFLYLRLGRKYFSKGLFSTEVNDLSNVMLLEKMLASTTDVVHLAGSIDYNASLAELAKRNVVPARNVAKACKAVGCRMILASSASVTRKESPIPINEETRPAPISAYGKSKLLAEVAVVNSGAGHVIARFPIIYGEGFYEGFSKVVEMARNGKLQVIGDGGNKISFIHIDDVVSAYLAILAHREVKSGVFYFSSRALTQNETYSILCDALEVPSPAKKISKALAIASIRAKNTAIRLFGQKPSFTEENLRTLADNREFDCSKARRTFGWQPRVKFGKESLGPYL